MSLIVEGDKDWRCLAWLEARYEFSQIAAAAASVEATGRPAYLSHVTKALGARIPDEVWGMQPQEFEVVKARLRALRDEFAAKVKFAEMAGRYQALKDDGVPAHLITPERP